MIDEQDLPLEEQFNNELDKADTMLDLMGGERGSISVLQHLLANPELEAFPAIKAEAHAFLARIHLGLNEPELANLQLLQMQALDQSLLGDEARYEHLEEITHIQEQISAMCNEQ